MTRRIRAAAAAALVALALPGCGGGSATSKQDLTDKDKQQIGEFQKQRADEWGNAKDKKK